MSAKTGAISRSPTSALISIRFSIYLNCLGCFIFSKPSRMRSANFRHMFSLPRLVLLFALLAFLFPRPILAVEAKLTLLFTGDQDGQIDSLPLSDPSQPVGGM